MADVLDRIDKLIALALNNPNEEEARSAALAAVKSIREHKITLSPPGVSPQPSVPSPPHYQSPFAEQQQAANHFAYWYQQMKNSPYNR